MLRYMLLLAGLAFLGTLGYSPAVRACPNCKDAVTVENAPEDEDPLREARAYNNSIYFMVGMPYLLLAAAGFVIYRNVRAGQKQAELPGDESDLAAP